MPVEFIVKNAGTIKNVSFMNIAIPNTVVTFTGVNGGLVRYNLAIGVIQNVTIEGVKEGLGAMVAATNRGLITNVELDIVTYNSTAAIAARNYGTLSDSSVTAEFNYTSYAQLYHKGGVVAENYGFYDSETGYDVLIDNVHATIVVFVDVNQADNSSFMFGGFVGITSSGSRQRDDGSYEQFSSMVSNSSVDITFETLNYPVFQVGDFAYQKVQP